MSTNVSIKPPMLQDTVFNTAVRLYQPLRNGLLERRAKRTRAHSGWWWFAEVQVVAVQNLSQFKLKQQILAKKVAELEDKRCVEELSRLLKWESE